jgi:hypothetical protein
LNDRGKSISPKKKIRVFKIGRVFSVYKFS